MVSCFNGHILRRITRIIGGVFFMLSLMYNLAIMSMAIIYLLYEVGDGLRLTCHLSAAFVFLRECQQAALVHGHAKLI